MTTVHINLPAGSSITLLPGRTEPITITALPQDPATAPNPIKVRILGTNLEGVTLSIDNGPPIDATPGDVLTLNYPAT